MTDYLPPENTTAPATSTAVPHSREAEEAVVGAVFINPEVYYDVAQFLSADDFYIHRHKWIWDAFTSLHEQRIPIDLLTVSDELDRRGQLSEVGRSEERRVGKEGRTRGDETGRARSESRE